jgi:hypothetical protein
MSRVVKLDGPGKQRNQLMRTAAEVLRRLSEKSQLDEEAQDMAALLVFCFREIDSGIDDSVTAWEKRDYWVKAERFRARWSWAGPASRELEKVVRGNSWDQLPVTLIKVLPHLEEIKISKYTRKPSIWRGAYSRLLHEHSKQPEN